MRTKHSALAIQVSFGSLLVPRMCPLPMPKVLPQSWQR